MAKSKRIHIDNYQELEDRGKRLDTLIKLSNNILEKELRVPITFNEFLYLASSEPELVFRDVFRLFYDMIHYYVPQGQEEYPELSESIGFISYDSSNLFVNNCDNPFFADRLFSNRFMNLVDNFRNGSFNNHIFLFEGPPGSGKSTFLNNILQKLEEYTKTPEGIMYKTYWRLDVERLGGFQKFESALKNPKNNNNQTELIQQFLASQNVQNYNDKYLQFSCPKHDHPILQIPKSYRADFLDELILDKSFKEKLFNQKQYEWILQDIPCNICKSIYSALMDIIGDPLEVYTMINARKARYNRQFGEGISVFNPGDPLYNKPITNIPFQNMLNSLLKTDNIDFIYSYLAKTNNGVMALMDIKEFNIERLKSLHGIISDGVHKVELIEESINTLFVGLVNPEDKVHYENVKSFQDRIITVNIPYILDFNTEVAIYKNKFGKDIVDKFLPNVLENFSKIIISSRMDIDSTTINKWLFNTEKYNKYLDKNKLLLKMDIYTGKIPEWLDDQDIKRFDKETRKAVLADSEKEGKKGFSGRMSLNIFNDFLSLHSKNDKLITMEIVSKFFSENDKLYKEVPSGFINSLVDMYDYNVLQEVKEAIYYYNEEQISRDILHYLFAINFDIGTKEFCEYTNTMVEITQDLFKNFEAMFLGTTSTMLQRTTFREDARNEYIKSTLASEIRLQGKNITDTQQYLNLFEKYTRNLKENALAPYSDNDNFRRAINDFNTSSFSSYDDRLKRDINLLITNLQKKFKYTIDGAKEISLYVLDKKLEKKY